MNYTNMYCMFKARLPFFLISINLRLKGFPMVTTSISTKSKTPLADFVCTILYETVNVYING